MPPSPALYRRVPPVAKRRGSEFRAYPDIRDNLRRLGWNTDSPSTNPDGDVYDQHEAAADDGLRKALGKKAPEHVVVVDKTKRIFWTIEAKGTMAELDKAVDEARQYAELIDAGAKQRGAFYTGIAGNPTEGYLRSTYYIDTDGIHSKVTYDGTPITSLLPRETMLYIVKSDSAALLDLLLDEGELLRTAAVINETLHAASINKDDRAPVVASILLTMAMDNMPDAHLPPNDLCRSDQPDGISATGQGGQAAFRRTHRAPVAKGRRRATQVRRGARQDRGRTSPHQHCRGDAVGD